MSKARKILWPVREADEAEIQKKIASDPDAPEATDEELAQARPFAEVFPDLAESIRRAEAEREASRERVDLDGDVVAKFRATGEGWEERINQVLRAAKL
ncbi:hypothetical protein ASG39_11510 [Rhizobium sp. Leaf371]|uniref:BrnA antitoxin family protein n=1 Tax=Rhizobium sp. Leaf371 TaxID=1736355 RepID=UPI0007140CCA|nr:BrnA antitoxin family protein [Rhizobium sp. Leaf371]KQS64571.1 hypothetical protein ASG39_11510 [Rhizobium sp. Leaf371]